VKAILPASFSFRRANRGLESIAVSGDKTRAYTCQQSTMDGDNKAGAITTAQNSRVIRCAVLDISDPLNAQLVSEKYFFASPAFKHPYAKDGKTTNATSGVSTWKAQKQADIKISAAYWLRDNKVALLERTDGMVRFLEVDFDTGDNLQQSSLDTARGVELKLKESKFARTSNFFEGLANLEAATTCSSSSCSNACCPSGTCDTASVCTSASTSPEKGFTGLNWPISGNPLAMRSRVILDIYGDTIKEDGEGKPLGASGLTPAYGWENVEQMENIFGTGTKGEYGMGMLWKVEGFFMINQYHMALINDNDFGLEGNTHVQIAIIQLDAKSMIGLDPCMSASLSCSTDTFPIPTKCSVSGNVPAAYKAPPPPDYGTQPMVDAEIGVYTIVGLFVLMGACFVCKPYIFDGQKLETGMVASPDVKTKSIEEGGEDTRPQTSAPLAPNPATLVYVREPSPTPDLGSA